MAVAEVSTGAVLWKVREDSLADLVPILQRLAARSLPPGFASLRENRVRAVLRGSTGAGPVVVKRFKMPGWAERLATLFRPSAAVREWNASGLLAARAIPTPQRLAVGERRDAGPVREAFYIAREATGTRPAMDRAWWTADQGPAFFAALGRFVRRVHDADIWHPDLHLGNVLVRRNEGGFAFSLIDLHSVPPLTGLDRRRALANLAHGRNSLPDEHAHRIHDFLAGYFETGDTPLLSAAGARRDVERLARSLRLRRFASRQARCLKESSGYRVSRAGGLRIHHRADLAARDLATAYGTFRKGDHPTLKEDLAATVRAGFPVGSLQTVVKEYSPRGFTQTLKAVLGRCRGRRAYSNGNGLRVRGVGVAEPLALVLTGRPRLGPVSAVFLEDLTLWTELDRLCDDASASGDHASLRALARALGAFLGRMHGRGAAPDDCKACNVMARAKDEGWDLRLLDHDGVRFASRLSTGRIVRALAQVNNSVPRSISRADRARALRAWVEAEGTDRHWKDLFRAVWERSRNRGILWVSRDGEDRSASWER